jgi:exodeoxyribonuclease V alpha subunit
MNRTGDNLKFADEALEKLEGVVERVTFHSEETGYTVARVKSAGRRDPVTVVGRMANPAPGVHLVMEGRWTAHPKYGDQFAIEQCREAAPVSLGGIEKYLASGAIKGVGRVMARRLVERFGENTLEVIENEPERLTEVEGVGPKRIEMIRRAWEEHKESRAVMVFLQEHGVSPVFAAKIFKKYGQSALNKVRENPFRLANDIAGIGFKSADRIAGTLGFRAEDPARVEAGLIHVLGEADDDGHVFYPYEPLVERTAEMLGVGREPTIKALAALAEQGRLVIENQAAGDRAVYLRGLHVAEKGVAARLTALLAVSPAHRPIDADKAVEWVRKELKIKLAPLQAEAVRKAAANKVLVITGGPGTGKTTIIRSILAIFDKIVDRILLTAPTGRAAKRMSEATLHEARTVHRLLEYNPREGGFMRHEKRPLEADLLIVDEASMLDVRLTHQLLKAVPDAAAMILVGDVDQLPSVGPGNVLGDVIASGRVPLVRLTEVFRQAGESSIVSNAHCINKGKMPVLTPAPDRLDDFYFIERPDPAAAVRTIIELVSSRIPKRFGLDPIEDVQVLSPMHRGEAGASNLNEVLRKTLNPREQVLTRGGQRFGLADKVMQVRNDYEREVFNGDIGRVRAVDVDRSELLVEFDGRTVLYQSADLDELQTAYAITVHKSQGSEYPAVIVPVLTQHYLLLQRNLIYTAVTRGKKLVVLVGDKKALAIAVNNDKTRQRYSLLARRLEEASGK